MELMLCLWLALWFEVRQLTYLDLSVFIWKMETVILILMASWSSWKNSLQWWMWNKLLKIQSHKIYGIVTVILVLYVLKCFAIISPNRLSCLRNISRSIVFYFLKATGTEGVDPEFMKQSILLSHCILYQESQTWIPSGGFIEDINWS